MRERFGDHVAALVEVEERLGLLGITNGGHHDLVEDVRRALDDFQVPVVEGIKGAGDETNGHTPPSSGSNIVTSVVP